MLKTLQARLKTIVPIRSKGAIPSYEHQRRSFYSHPSPDFFEVESLEFYLYEKMVITMQIIGNSIHDPLENGFELNQQLQPFKNQSFQIK